MSLGEFRFFGWFQFFGWKSKKLQGVHSHGRNGRRSGSHAWHSRLTMEPLEQRTLLSVINWVSPTGGDWDTPSNWRDDQAVARLPGPGDDAVIDLPGITVTHQRAVADAIHNLNSSDPIIFSAGTLAIAAASTITSNLTLTGGTITGPGDLTVTGMLVWSGGTMSGTGATTVKGLLVMGAANGSNQSETLDQRTLNIAGPASYGAAGTFATSDRALAPKNPVEIALNAPTAPGSYVAYHDDAGNGINPIITKGYYPDNSLNWVKSTSPTQTTTWTFNDDAENGATIGSLDSITEQEDYGGETYTVQWDYISGSLTSVTQTETYGTDYSSNYTWEYNSDGKLTYASEEYTYADGYQSFEWINNDDGSPASITETQNNSDGSGNVDVWTYNNNGTLAKITRTDDYSDGSISAYAWNYSNGILNSASQQDTYSDGFSYNCTWTYNSNGSPASITLTDDYSNGSSSVYAWNYSNGILNSASQQDTYSDGSSYNYTWTYNGNGSPASITETDDNADRSSAVYAWTYNSDGTPASITVTQDNSDGSDSACTCNYSNGILISATEHDDNSDGSSTDYTWTYNSDGTPAKITEAIKNTDGLLASTATWTYSNGILNYVTRHVNNSDGTSTDYVWDNNADGSLVICNWTNYANGSSSTVSKQVYNAAGILVNSYQWSFYADGSLNSYTKFDYTTDGSQVDNAAYLNGIHGADNSVTSFHQISYLTDGELVLEIADLNSDGTSTFFHYAVNESTGTYNETLSNYNADGCLVNQTGWGVSLTTTYVIPYMFVVDEYIFNTDGSHSFYGWGFLGSTPDGAQGGILESFGEGWSDASGNQVTNQLWRYDHTDGSLSYWSSSGNGFGYSWTNNGPCCSPSFYWVESHGPIITEWALYTQYDPEILIGQQSIDGGSNWTYVSDAPDFEPSPLPGLTPPPQASIPDISVPTTPSPTNTGATSPPTVNRSPDLAPPSAPVWYAPAPLPTPVPLHAPVASEPSEAPIAPDLIEVNSVSTTDSREVTVDYDIIGPDLNQPFDIGIYRSSTATYGAGINVLVGSVSVSGDFLQSGEQQETLSLSDKVIYRNLGVDLISPLAPDPLLPYVLATADADGLPYNVSTDASSAHFRIYVIGAVVQGFGPDQPWVDGSQGWKYGNTQMASLTDSLKAQGYSAVIPVHWYSSDPLADEAAQAGDDLFQTIEDAARAIPSLGPNDVIDVHLIGHSRGAAVIDETMNDLVDYQSSLPAQLAHGFYKMTLLDPHPANSATKGDVTINPAISAAMPAALADLLLPGLDDDPSIDVPSRVNEVEDYYQKTPYSKISSFDLSNDPNERYYDFQGLSLQDMSIEDTDQTIATSYDLTSKNLGQSEVYGWYEQTIVPTLRTLAPLVLDGPDSPGEGTGRATRLYILPSPSLPIGPDGNPDLLTGAQFSLYVFALNAQGNPDTAFNGSVTLALATNPGNSVLGGTLTVSAVNGMATFSDLTMTNPGSGYTFEATSNKLTSATSVPIDVEPYQLVLTNPPPDSVAAGSGFGLAVTVEDGAGHVYTSFNGNVTITLRNYFGGTAPLGGTVTVQADQGVATFSGLTIGSAGDYLLTATSDGLTGTSSPISVTAGTASRIAVSNQPATNVTVGSGFGLVFSAEDAEGNVDTTFDGDVTLALANNLSGGDLGGTLTVPAINGIAKFHGLNIDKAGSGYTLVATGTGLSPATSNPLDITAPGVATHLVVTTQPPSEVTAKSGFTLSVSAEDDFGAVDTSFQGNVAIAIKNDASNTGTLGGTRTVPAVAGVATFSGLTLSTADDYYIIQASSAGLGAGLANAIDVTSPGAATEIVVTTQPPHNVAVGGSFGLVVSAEDGFGKVDTSFNGSVTVALLPNGPFGSYATLGGTLTLQAVDGVAIFSNLTLDQFGPYELSVTSPGLPATTTSSILVGNPFAGSYTGTMTGTATGPNGTESVNSNISLSAYYDGTVYLFDPGYGQGTVSQDGAVSITGSGSFGDLQSMSFSLTGTAMISSPGALSASGDWSFSDGSGSGTWSATASNTVPVTPTISWSTPAAIVYGTPLSTSQLDASATVPGTFSYLPANGSVLAAGNNQTLRVTFTPTDTTDYTTATLTTTINVTPAPLTITADNKSIVYGAPLPTLTASYSGFVNGDMLATSGVTGAPSLTCTATTTSPVGTYTITAAQGTLAANNYNFTFLDGTLTINPRPPQIWDGGGADNLWKTKENWVDDVAPLPGDSLIFPQLNPPEPHNVYNDFANGTVFGSITVSGSGYHFQGNAYQSSMVEVQANTNVEVNAIYTDTLTIGAGATVTISPISSGPQSQGTIKGVDVITNTSVNNIKTDPISLDTSSLDPAMAPRPVVIDEPLPAETIDPTPAPTPIVFDQPLRAEAIDPAPAPAPIVFEHPLSAKTLDLPPVLVSVALNLPLSAKPVEILPGRESNSKIRDFLFSQPEQEVLFPTALTNSLSNDAPGILPGSEHGKISNASLVFDNVSGQKSFFPQSIFSITSARDTALQQTLHEDWRADWLWNDDLEKIKKRQKASLFSAVP